MPTEFTLRWHREIKGIDLAENIKAIRRRLRRRCQSFRHKRQGVFFAYQPHDLVLLIPPRPGEFDTSGISVIVLCGLLW